jgi:hypothetical protein
VRVQSAEKSGIGEIERPRLPFLWIILASALAHLWCLGSVFYLDDKMAILDNEVVKTGRFWEYGLSAWTALGYGIQYRLFGFSPVGFHGVNWLLHAAIACVLFGFGRSFLRDRWPVGVALFGALLFAVHPLASEIPNYARTQDLAWVTLFSLLASWAMLEFLRDGAWWKLFGCGVCILGAMFSKGPGLFHALMMVGVVGVVTLSPDQWRMIRQKAWILIGVFAILIAAMWRVGLIDAIPDVSNPRFIGHAYTLSRVFWEFAWRSVFPVGLSSDHEITETLIPPGGGFFPIPDTVAMIAAFAFLALVSFSGFLTFRKSTRLFGVCLLLYVGSILFRVIYLIPEFMPEYRIYPGLPWFCLGAAILLAAGWKSLFETMSPRVPALVLLILFAGLSAKRSFVWHDLDRLTGDVLERYPARARAVWELHSRDVKQQNWQAIIKRQRQVWPGVERRFVTENQRLAPGREIPSGDFVLAMVGIFGNYAIAVSHAESPAAGLRIIAQLEAHMKQMKMTPADKPLEWAYFYHAKAMVLETAGKFQAAIDILRQPEFIPETWKPDLERLEKKRSQPKPDS